MARTAGGQGGSVLGNMLVFGGVLGEAAYVLLARRIAGKSSSAIEAELGYMDEPELIHRDNLVLIQP